MATSLTRLTVKNDSKTRWEFTNLEDISQPVDAAVVSKVNSLANGTADGQANELWRDRRTVTPATDVDDIDLYGVLENVFGQTINFAEITGIHILNNSTTAGYKLLVGGAGLDGNALTSLFDGDPTAKIPIGPNGEFKVTNPLDGYVVTAASGDILRVAHAGGPSEDISYDIVIYGRTA